MAGAIDIALSDLEGRFAANLVRGVFCDNGSGQPGPRLQRSISSGRRIADALLLKAWSETQIETLIAEDEAIRGAVLDLILSEGMAGRMEWDVPGGPRSSLRKNGMETLKLLAEAELRSIAENHGAGTNPHTRRASVRTERNPHTFIFAPSKAQPRRGGF